MFLIVLYLVAVVLANLTVTWFGPSISIVNAFVLIALDLSSRDTLHERWKGKGLWWRMTLLIGSGSLLSYLLNTDSARIALASFAAFTVSSVLDTTAYIWLYNRDYMVKSNGSNIVSAASDCGCALDKLLDGATIEQGREEYFKAKIRRGALDRAMGLPQDFIR